MNRYTVVATFVAVVFAVFTLVFGILWQKASNTAEARTLELAQIQEEAFFKQGLGQFALIRYYDPESRGYSARYDDPDYLNLMGLLIGTDGQADIVISEDGRQAQLNIPLLDPTWEGSIYHLTFYRGSNSFSLWMDPIQIQDIKGTN